VCPMKNKLRREHQSGNLQTSWAVLVAVSGRLQAFEIQFASFVEPDNAAVRQNDVANQADDGVAQDSEHLGFKPVLFQMV